MKTLDNQRGVTAIATLLILLSLLAMGSVIAYTSAAGQSHRFNHLQSARAFYVNQGAVEYAMRKIYEGEGGEVTTAVDLGKGSFKVRRFGNTLRTSGVVERFSQSFGVDRPAQSQCIKIDTTGVVVKVDGKRIVGIKIKKDCLDQIVISGMRFGWAPDGGERLMRIQIGAVLVHDNPLGVASGTDIDIVDYVLADGSSHFVSADFDSSIQGTTMLMKLTLSDSSTQEIPFPAD